MSAFLQVRPIQSQSRTWQFVLSRQELVHPNGIKGQLVYSKKLVPEKKLFYPGNSASDYLATSTLEKSRNISTRAVYRSFLHLQHSDGLREGLKKTQSQKKFR